MQHQKKNSDVPRQGSAALIRTDSLWQVALPRSPLPSIGCRSSTARSAPDLIRMRFFHHHCLLLLPAMKDAAWMHTSSVLLVILQPSTSVLGHAAEGEPFLPQLGLCAAHLPPAHPCVVGGGLSVERRHLLGGRAERTGRQVSCAVCVMLSRRWHLANAQRMLALLWGYAVAWSEASKDKRCTSLCSRNWLLMLCSLLRQQLQCRLQPASAHATVAAQVVSAALLKCSRALTPGTDRHLCH